MRTASAVGLLVLVLGSGCGGSEVLLDGEFDGQDSAGAALLGGSGEGYPEGEEPAWPLSLRLLIEGRKRTGSDEEAVPLTSVSGVSVSATEGATCAQSGEGSCAQVCSVNLEFTGPGTCAVQVRLDSTEGPLEGCFVYTIAPSDGYQQASAAGHALCPE